MSRKSIKKIANAKYTLSMGIFWIHTHLRSCSNRFEYTASFTKILSSVVFKWYWIQKVYSSRDDYIRNDSEYDKWLLNSDWKVTLCITYDKDNVPMILTCRHHKGWYNKDYLHLPRQPHNILTSDKCNQLCHAVIKTRTIKPIKANKYSNTYHIHE